jgi:hypothetical protein
MLVVLENKKVQKIWPVFQIAQMVQIIQTFQTVERTHNVDKTEWTGDRTYAYIINLDIIKSREHGEQLGKRA